MKKIIALIFAICLLMSCIAVAGHEAWDCTCGRKGNTGNFCGNCGKSYEDALSVTTSDIEQSTNSEKADSETERKFEFVDVTVHDGLTTIRWIDSAGNAPYELDFSYCSSDFPGYYENIDEGTGLRKEYDTYAYDCIYLVPGETHDIVLYDKDGNSISKTVALPSAELLKIYTLQYAANWGYVNDPTNDALNKVKKLSASQIVSDIADKKYKYCCDIEINGIDAFPSGNCVMLFAFYAPNGYIFPISFCFEPRDYDQNLTVWVGDKFFPSLFNECKTIPVGQYKIKIFMNGKLLNTHIFTVDY